MWYSEKDFEALDVDKRSLVVASANLTQKFDISIDPVKFYAELTQEDSNIDWWNVAEYTDGIDIGRVVEDNSWPDSSLSIVKFRRLDEAAAGLVDHYCLVADHRAHSIVDSLDATIKSAVEYGEVIGWASYVREAEQEEEVVDEITEIENALVESGLSANKLLYVVGRNESIWDVARKLSLSVESLIKFNEIDDPRYVKEGYTLRIPAPTFRDTQDVIYELLEEPMVMHVSAPTGTTKFSFGNATKWSDIKPTTRRYPFQHQVVISAIAHVPLADEPESAKYYMEAVDVGVGATTDRVRYTVGFSHAHMKEGVYTPPEPPKVVHTVIEQVEKPKPLTHAPAPAATINKVDGWKNSQAPLLVPEVYFADETMTVYDLDRKHPPITLHAAKGVKIYSTFIHEGRTYGRPLASARRGSWYGIPMDKMTVEDEVYDYNVSLADKVAMHSSLTFQERGVVYLSRMLSQGTKIKTFITKHK